ncbi:hypothetical protein L1887_48626 [Cichorium endivia]|nr:hypothetical protein L1887_48626 [Cichorium endivia]
MTPSDCACRIHQWWAYQWSCQSIASARLGVHRGGGSLAVIGGGEHRSSGLGPTASRIDHGASRHVGRQAAFQWIPRIPRWHGCKFGARLSPASLFSTTTTTTTTTMSLAHQHIVAAAAAGDSGSLARIFDAILDGDDQHPSSHRMANANAALVRASSLCLHERLTTRYPPAEWPLVQLRNLLDIIFEPSNDDAHRAASPLPLHPTERQQSTPSTPPRAPAQHDMRVRPTLSPPSRARSCADQLASLTSWPALMLAHEEVVQTGHEYATISLWIRLLHAGRAHFASVLPDLHQLLASDLAAVRAHLIPRVRAAYAALQHRPNEFTQDQALAFVLVNLPLVDPPRPDPDARDSNVHLSGQFGLPFHGDAHHRFLHFIHRVRTHFALPNIQPPYYYGTPIVQSSGTGKTRMVVELRHRAPLLYLCLRSRAAQGDARAGYPLPDRGVLDYFAKEGRSFNLQIACFLAAWFAQLAHDLGEIETDNKAKARCDIDKLKFQHLVELNDLVSFKGRGVNDPRDPFFIAVAQQAADLLDQQPTTLDAQSHHHIFDKLLPQPIVLLSSKLRGVLDHLRSLHPHEPEPPVLVAFDECVELSSRQDRYGDSLLDCLRRAWKYVGDHGQSGSKHRLCFWLVLMSTSSSAAHLVDRVGAANSLRRQVSAPLPTFVAASFDVHAANGRHQVATASGVAELEHIRKYGRPLWCSLERDQFWSTAQYKLTGAHAFSSESALHCYSVLASRLALGLVPAYASAQAVFQEQKLFAQQAVDRHMRIVTAVTPDASMRVESPSEPVLAIAASLIMLSAGHTADSYRSILSSFHRRCLVAQSVLLFKGTYGELAARLALLAAWDAAKRTHLDAAAQAEDQRATGLDAQAQMLAAPERLQTVLSQLAKLKAEDEVVLNDHIDAVRRRISQRLQCPETKVQAWMHYTHFDVLPITVSQISPDYLWYCWKRGVALQMAHAQTGIDGIIPVFVGDLEQHLGSPSDADADSQAALHMTFVAWQAKHRKKPQSSAETLNLDGPRLMPSPDASSLTQNALVTILLDLGTSASFSSSQDQTPQLDRIVRSDCLRLSIRGTTDPRAYPCLDKLNIRDVMGAVLATPAEAENALHDNLNTFDNPICNTRWQPERNYHDTLDAADQAEPMEIA